MVYLELKMLYSAKISLPILTCLNNVTSRKQKKKTN